MASQRLRYLPNVLPDYKGAEVEVPVQNILDQIQNYVSEILLNYPPEDKTGKDGIYLGSAGVSYMFYHLTKIPELHLNVQTNLNNALDYIRPALKECTTEVNRKNIPAFLLGNCGVYAVACVVNHALGKEAESAYYRDLYNSAASTCKELNFLNSGSDELFVGRAGYICGALWMAKETNVPFNKDDIYDICGTIIASGRKYSKRNKSPVPLMYSYYGMEYLGAGHGLCTILQMLLSVPGYLDANPADANAIKQTVDYVLNLQDEDGNFPSAVDDVKAKKKNDLIHWCHGAGGMVYILGRATVLWGEQPYLNACVAAADLIWVKGLLRKGPGLCHGVAGNGYVFLLLHRLTEDPKYLYRAVQFSQYLENEDFKTAARVPDNPYSLFEGISGTVCFLADILNPQEAAFPFSNIF